MRVSKTDIDGPLLIEPVVHGDARGFFVEAYRRDTLAEAGVDHEFIQDNHSRSRSGVIRGLHFQAGQTKLVRCVRGAIFDVAVDVRVGSPNFGRWVGYRLDDETHRELLIPDGFAHGFCVLSELADVTYKVSAYYDPSSEGGFRFDDPEVGVEWPTEVELVISDRDRAAPTLAELADSLPFKYFV
jgi:dTDP-4-dehydrorhamnose 3,5-epimerase